MPGLYNQGKELWPILVFYVVLGTAVFVLIKLPMLPDWLKVIACAGLLFFATDPRNVHQESPQRQQHLPFQQTRLLDMAWLWEVNIAQVRLERMVLFDYFIRGKESPVPWKLRPAKFLENDQRAIGALQFSYTAKIGIDLKQVLVRYDLKQKTVYYWIPDPQQTGAVAFADHWPIRTTLHYTTGKRFWDVGLDWRWRGEDMTALPFWEQIRADHYQDALTTQHIDEQLDTVVRNEADRRLKILLETLLDYRAVAVSKEQLTEAETLGVLLPRLMKKAMIEESSPAESTEGA